MIDTNLWIFSSAVKLDPGEWSLLNTETPYVTDSFLACVSTKDKEVWLREDNGVAISSTRG